MRWKEEDYIEIEIKVEMILNSEVMKNQKKVKERKLKEVISYKII